MNKDKYINSDDDPNLLELDISTVNINQENPLANIQVRSNLPRHIDDVLEKEMSSLMSSIKSICLKNVELFEKIEFIFKQNIKITLIKEIKDNLKYLKGLTEKKQINTVKSIIGDYLFNVDIVIAFALGNKEKILKLLKFDKRKYSEKDFIKAQKLRNKTKMKYDDALLDIFKKNLNSPPELKDKTSLEFYNASIAFRQYRSRENKKRSKEKIIKM